jgi:hypothetical protein
VYFEALSKKKEKKQKIVIFLSAEKTLESISLSPIFL